MRRVLLWLSAALVVLVAAAVGFLFLVDLSRFRPMVEEQASAALGRAVTIAGELEIKPSLTPTLAVSQVAIANIPDGSRDEMARIGRLEIGLELLPLFGGEVSITHIVVVEPDIVLEFGADGVGNWAFDPGGTDADPAEESSGDGAGLPFIGRVELQDATISHTGLDGRARGLDIKSAVLATASKDDDVQIEIESVIDGLPIQISATTGSLAAFLAGAEGWPIDVSAEIAESRIAIRGTIDDPLTLAALSVEIDADVASLDSIGRIVGQELSGIPPFQVHGSVTGDMDDELHLKIAVNANEYRISVDGSITEPAALAAFTMDIEAEIESLAPLAGILGAPPPNVPAFAVRGTVAGDPDELRLIGLDLTFGDSDLSGDLTIARSATPPGVTGEFRSERLVVADLPSAAAPGNGDGGGPAETVSADEIDPLDRPLPVDALAAANIDVRWSASEIVLSDSTTREFEVAIRLQDRRLTVSIPGVRMSQGTLTANAALNARQQPPSARLDVATEAFNIGGLLRDLQVTDVLTLRMDAKVNLDSTGATPRALLAGLNGDIVVEADEGEISALFADLLGRSLLTAILPIGESNKAKINCAVAHFVVADGTVQSTALGVDTDNVTIGGKGGLDLRAETIDFFFTPQTKDATLMALVAPVRIHGSLTAPEISVVTTEMLVSAVKDTLLFPFAIVLPFMPGTSDEPENCQAALYELLTSPPPPSAPERIVGGAVGAVGGVAEGTVGLVKGVVGGIGDAIGGLFGGGDEPATPADN